MTRRSWTVPILSFLLSLNGCSCSSSNGAPGDGGGDGQVGVLPDGSVFLPDGAVLLPDGNVIPAPDGAMPSADAGSGGDAGPGVDAGPAPDGGPTADAGGDGGWGMFPDGGCHPIACQGHIYACGDCMDNDGDGKIDAYDPDCLGPCDNNESGYGLMIPGGDPATCSRDCYYDQDSGSGNDDCNWDTRCESALARQQPDVRLPASGDAQSVGPLPRPPERHVPQLLQPPHAERLRLLRLL